jgi:hypothetical protein
MIAEERRELTEIAEDARDAFFEMLKSEIAAARLA